MRAPHFSFVSRRNAGGGVQARRAGLAELEPMEEAVLGHAKIGALEKPPSAVEMNVYFSPKSDYLFVRSCALAHSEHSLSV